MALCPCLARSLLLCSLLVVIFLLYRGLDLSETALKSQVNSTHLTKGFQGIEVTVTKNITQDITRNAYRKIAVNNKEANQQSGFDVLPSRTCSQNTTLLLAIISDINHIEHRNHMRKWIANIQNNGSLSAKTGWRIQLSFIFIIGQAKGNSSNTILKKEASTYGDILVGTLVDSYRNWVHKSI